MENFSQENEFDLHKNGHAGETNSHNSFVLRLVLTQKQTRIQKWLIKPVLNEQGTGYKYFKIN